MNEKDLINESLENGCVNEKLKKLKYDVLSKALKLKLLLWFIHKLIFKEILLVKSIF